MLRRDGAPAGVTARTQAARTADPACMPGMQADWGCFSAGLFTVSLFFSISLLGKPPHSSIMSMATGKNLQSIPKKVSDTEPMGLGFSQGR